MRAPRFQRKLSPMPSLRVCRQALLLALTFATAGVSGSTPVPLTVLSGRADGLVPAVEGTLRGHAFWFDLDTGALESFFDISQARVLGLPSVSPTTVRGAGAGHVDALRLDNVGVHLGQIVFTAHQPLAVDLSKVGSAFQLGGLLGYDFFCRYVVAIDFASYRIKLYEPRSYRYTGTGAAMPLILRAPRAYVNVMVAARGVKAERHLLRVDLGSSDAVDDDIVLRSSAPKKVINGGVGLGRRFSSYLGTVTELRLGPFILHDLPSATGGVQLIGDEVWHRFDIVFDFSRSVMYLSPR